MDIYKDIRKLNRTPCVLALGNFDGVHLGHKKLLEAVSTLSKELGCLAGIYTFEVNSKILLGAKSFSLLTTDGEKNRIFSDCDMDFVCYDDFGAIKDYSPEEFCNYLTENTGVKAVVCGENYTFGKFACASSKELIELMSERGIGCVTVPGFYMNGVCVSSTAIRLLLSDGKTDDASEMLGYRYFIETTVEHGAKLGRKLGFPTINQYCYGGKTIPAKGVYCCICTIDGEKYMGVVNVGVKPTVTEDTENARIVFETYILDYSGDLYGKSVKLEFYKMLRQEKKFASLDELRKNVMANIEETRIYFGKERNTR